MNKKPKQNITNKNRYTTARDQMDKSRIVSKRNHNYKTENYLLNLLSMNLRVNRQLSDLDFFYGFDLNKKYLHLAGTSRISIENCTDYVKKRSWHIAFLVAILVLICQVSFSLACETKVMVNGK